MFQNGQTHFKNLAAFALRFVKCVWSIWDIMYYSVKWNWNFSSGQKEKLSDPFLKDGRNALVKLR